MILKNKYISPQIEVIDVEMDADIMIINSPSGDLSGAGNVTEGSAYSNQRTFWGD